MFIFTKGEGKKQIKITLILKILIQDKALFIFPLSEQELEHLP